MPADVTEIARSFHATFAKRDATRAIALLHPEIEWTAAENFLYHDHSPYRGIDAVIDLLFRRVIGDWDELNITYQEVMGGGDLVISSGRFRGVYRKNGRPIDAQIVFVFQIRDGKILRAQVYADTAQFKETVSAIRSASL